MLLVTASVLAASCQPEKIATSFGGGAFQQTAGGILLNTHKVWNPFDLPAYIGDISYLPADLQTVINQRFPNHGDIGFAKVLFIGAADMAADAEQLKQAAEEGAFIVYPDNVDPATLGIQPLLSTFEEPGPYTVLFHCSSLMGLGRHFTLWDEPVLLAEAGEVTSSFSDAEWEELVQKNMALGQEDGWVLSDYDNDADHNVNYFQTRLDPFVDWLEKDCMEQSMTKAAPYEDLRTNIEQAGQPLTHNFPFSLNNVIDQATGSDPDVLNKNSSVDVEFRIYPVYMQSSNGENAGDYYIVVSTITPHNASMWGPFVGSHGWTRNRVYGYWFNTMDVKTSLVNPDGSSIAGLSYFERPIPENQNTSKQYSNGKSVSLNGSVTGGWGGSAAKGVIQGSFSVGGTWTSSTNYALETISYSLDSSSPTVHYNYWTNNVKLTDDYDDWNKINNVNFPPPVRTEFSAHTMWTWHIPGTTVKDGDTRQYKLKVKLKLNYSSWYHWRASAEFDGNRKDYDVNLPEISWTLHSPDRTPWGFIRLRNATSNEMAHVSFYVSGKEDGEPVAALTTSYGKGDEAWMALPEGTYSVKWDIVNGDTGARLGTYIYRDVKVHQGRDKDSATTAISSVDGTPLG